MEVLLDETYSFHREDSKTNLCIPITVQKKFESLEFIFSYTPKNVEDEECARKEIEEGFVKYVPPEYRSLYGNWKKYLPILNFITLSIDYEGSYVGCAHRHTPEQRHIISRNFSSPGFYKQAADAGAWRAVVNVHAIISSEVRLSLQVHGHDSL